MRGWDPCGSPGVGLWLLHLATTTCHRFAGLHDSAKIVRTPPINIATLGNEQQTCDIEDEKDVTMLFTHPQNDTEELVMVVEKAADRRAATSYLPFLGAFIVIILSLLALAHILSTRRKLRHASHRWSRCLR